MAYFEWADDLVIDNGPIDDDHKHLIALVNALHTATSEGYGQDVVGDVLHKLSDYTKGHLRREEHIMAMVSFPHLAEHKLVHERFVQDLNRLQQKYDGGSITAAAQLSTLLRDWLSLHIRRSDRQIRDYLVQTKPQQGMTRPAPK